MKALVLNGPEDMQVIEKPKPQPGPGEALIKVGFCGICGSDLHAYKAGMFPYGMTVGHEYAGIIESVGPGVTEWCPGQRVTGTASLACHDCRPCRDGQDNICKAMNVIGVTRDGAMADYLLVPEESLCEIPSGMPLEYGALVEPLSVAVHAINKVEATAEEIAVVVGAGTVGLFVLAELKRQGLNKVIVLEVNPARAAVACQMGADVVLNPLRDNVDDHLYRLTDGAGADLVFECVGLPDTIRDAGNLSRQGGTVLILGICEIPVEIFFLGLVTREIQLRTSYGATAEEFRRALCILAEGGIDLKPIISRIVSLEEIRDSGFDSLLEKSCPDVKVLVKIQ
ncbi:MAG TPA: alcohol dehydrogenase catalytic domain-containing protein [Candidatus Limnocylindrales bacterium]|nr:alcohol dehydrogenase catalytic domain-containing protein [Candidatus Limnocylindrales bacterium]